MKRIRFTANFQDLTLACFVNHPAEFLHRHELLKPKHFVGLHATIACRCLVEFIDRYKQVPTWEVLGQMVTNRTVKSFDESDGITALEYVERIRAMSTENHAFVSESLSSFAQYQAVVNAIKETIKSLQEGTDVDFIKLFEEALRVGQEMSNMGIIMSGSNPDFATDIIDRVTAKTYGIRTGFPIFDQIWPNGLGPGWLVVPLAPPKSFKTTVCTNMAINMAADGSDVLYYTCEISDELAVIRALCRLSGHPMSDMYANPEKFKEISKRRLREKLIGEILVKGFASKTATIRDIKNHARMAISGGLKPKAIFIDYAETIKASNQKDVKDYRQQADIYTEARAMGHELGCTIIMPDRCNRETVSMPVPNMASFQGAFEKAGIVDVAFGICCTEAERARNILRWFVFLNRHGMQFQHMKGQIDPELFKMEINESIEYNPEDSQEPRRRKRTESAVPDELVQ